MNEANKKIIEQASQTALLMQSITDKPKESHNPQKDGVRLLNKLGEVDSNGISAMDFHFVKNPLVVLRIDKDEHKMYDIQVIPKAGEKVVFCGKKCLVSYVQHKFDKDGSEISHSIVLSLEEIASTNL